MRKLFWIGACVGIGLLGVAIYARIAPSDLTRWHGVPDSAVAGDAMGQAVRIVPNGQDTFKRLDEIILATPRTQLLAGSIKEGRRTYITRTALFGFPDYTTIERRGDALVVFGRLRFGASDLGVNAKRLDAWMSQL